VGLLNEKSFDFGADVSIHFLYSLLMFLFGYLNKLYSLKLNREIFCIYKNAICSVIINFSYQQNFDFIVLFFKHTSMSLLS